MLPPLPQGRLVALVGTLAFVLGAAPFIAPSSWAATDLGELFPAADSTSSKAWSQTLTLDATSGLPDDDVLDATWQGDRLLAGTRSGLFANDGLTWTTLLDEGAIHWVDSLAGVVYAGGDRGLWRVDLDRQEVQPVAGAPDSIRSGMLAPSGRSATAPAPTSASEVDPSAATSAAEVDRRSGAADDLLIGTTHGLYRFGTEGDWTAELDSVSVTDLAASHEGRVYVGTFGQGLYWSDPPTGASGEWNVVRNPWIGVSDSLPGDFVHDIEIDGTGIIHLATSAYDVDPRYRIHENARLMGLVNEHESHAYAGAAYARWNHERWQVRHLYQHYRRAAGHGDRESTLALEEDVDEDGRIEVVFLLTPGRNLAPRGVVCFDRDSGALEWSHRLAGKPQRALLVSGPDGPVTLLLTNGSDHGARFDGRRDDTSAVYSIDAQGRLQILRQWPGWTSAAPWVLPRPGPEGPVPVGLYLLLSSLEPGGEQQVWYLDFTTWRWERAPLQDSIRIAPHSRALVDEAEHLALTLDDVPERILQLRDLATGRVVRDWRLSELLPGQPGHDNVQYQLLRVGERWEILVCGEQQYCLIDAAEVRRGALPEPEPGVPRSWLRGPEGEPPLVASYPSTGTFRVWRPKPGRVPPVRGVAPDYNPVAFALPDDLELPVLAADDFELLLTYVPQQGNLSFSNVRMISPGEPGEGRILSVTPGSDRIRVFDFEGRPRQTMALPEPLRTHPDLQWCSGRRAWVDGLDHDFYLGPCHGMPYVFVRHDPFARSAVTVYDPQWPFLDRGCVAIFALDPSHDLLATDRGIKRARWNQSGDLDPWLLRRPVRGMQSADRTLLAWGREGVAVLGQGARCVDPAVTDVLVDEKTVAWVRGTELGLRLLDRDADPTTRHWRLVPNRTDPGIDWQLHPSERGVWAWHIPPDRSTVSLRHFGADGEASRDLSEHLWHEGVTRPLSAAFALEDARWLLFADQGLLLADLAESERLFPIQDGRWSFRAAIETPEGWLGVGHRGELVEVRRSEDGFEAREQRRLPLAASDEVRQLLETGDGRFLITDSQVFHLPSDTVWEAPGGASLVSAAARHGGGLWLGTSEGLARLSLSSPELIELPVPGLPAAPVRRILDEDGPTGQSLAMVVSGHGLFRCELAAPTRLRVHATSDSVSVAFWPGAFSTPAAVEWRWQGEDRWQRAATAGDVAGRASFALDTPPQGRRQLELRAFDVFGREIAPPAAPSFVWRVSSPAVQGLLLLALAALAFVTRWRPHLPELRGRRFRTAGWVGRIDALPWSVPFLVLGSALLLLAHFAWLIEVPWIASAAVGVAVVGMDAVSLRRQARRRRAPEVARAELLERLSQFHHRGGRIGPIDELLLTLQNLGALSDGGHDPVRVVRDLCAQLLDATEPLRQDLVPLATDTGVDRWLVDRIESPLHFLRERALDAIAAPRESWPEILEARSKQSMVDAGHSFLGGIRTLHRSLLDEEGSDATQVVRDCVDRYRRQADEGIEIEASLPDGPLRTSIPQHELEELLDNLVRNAFTALRTSSEPRLHFTLAEYGGALRLRVEDNGPGIPDTVLPRLFEPGVSGGNGHGYGLARCQALVRSWGGGIVATNRTGTSGARFLIEVGRESSD